MNDSECSWLWGMMWVEGAALEVFGGPFCGEGGEGRKFFGADCTGYLYDLLVSGWLQTGDTALSHSLTNQSPTNNSPPHTHIARTVFGSRTVEASAFCIGLSIGWGGGWQGARLILGCHIAQPLLESWGVRRVLLSWVAGSCRGHVSCWLKGFCALIILEYVSDAAVAPLFYASVVTAWGLSGG